MISRLLCSVIAVYFVASCASVATGPEINEVDFAAEDNAILYVSRPERTMGGGVEIYIKIDNIERVSLKRSGVQKFIMAPGYHRVLFEGDTPLTPEEEEGGKNEYKDFEPGKTYFTYWAEGIFHSIDELTEEKLIQVGEKVLLGKMENGRPINVPKIDVFPENNYSLISSADPSTKFYLSEPRLSQEVTSELRVPVGTYQVKISGKYKSKDGDPAITISTENRCISSIYFYSPTYSASDFGIIKTKTSYFRAVELKICPDAG